MKFVIIAAMAAVMLASATEVAAQTPDQRIDTAFERAKQAGIPIALLESKVAEGKAKGVSLERIAAVVERRQATLERARRAMGSPRDLDAASLSVAADAVDAGVSDAVLKAVTATAPRERRAVAIAALTQLVQAGHGSQAALDRVTDALKRGPEALANLPAQAGAARGRAGGGAGEPGAAPGEGRGGAQGGGPPAAVPAPGKPAEPARPGGPSGRPGGPPENPGGPPTTPPGAGRGGPPQ